VVLRDHGGGKHTGESPEAEIFLVAQSLGASPEDADSVVEVFDEAERDLVLSLAVGAMPS
jgi:hypothetical protein